jgi:hypothetical protein
MDLLNQNAAKYTNDQMLQAQKDRNSNEADALRKMAQTSYILGGGSTFNPTASFTIGGRTIQTPDLGFGPRPASDAQKEAARTLQAMVQPRLASGGSYMPTAVPGSDLSKYQTPGVGEKLASYAGVGTSLLGATGYGDKLLKMFNLGSGAIGKTSVPGAMMSLGGAGGATHIPGAMLDISGGAPATATGVSGIMGKALPIAGAITGGIGLLKDRGVVGNVMNGVTAGASIGSMVPGLGTVVGAGIGALVGGLRSLGGGPSKTELAARDSAGVLLNQLAGQATPAQRAEAASAGWERPEEALANIVLRDKALASGHSADEAGAVMNQLFAARKKNPQAVAQVGSTLQQLAGLSSAKGPARPAGW